MQTEPVILSKEKRDNLERLLDALKSGKYAHGIGRLRTGDQYCCLGVMCDLVKPDGWINALEPMAPRWWTFQLDGQDSDVTTYPLEETTKLFGLLTRQGMLRGSRGSVVFVVNGVCRTSLAEVNDTETSFRAVILILEKYLENPNVEEIAVTTTIQ